MIEEILLKLGVDGSTVARGLRSVEESVQESAKRMRKGFNEVFEHLGSAFTAGALIAGVERLMSRVHDLKVEAESLDVGFGFLQGFQHASEEIGPGAEKGAKSLNVLSRTLGAAKEGSSEAIAKFEKLGISIGDIAGMNTEQMFYRVATAIQQTGDASVRTQMAFTVMGKAGVEMTGMLAQGGERLKEEIDEARKIAEEDAKQIEMLHRTLHEATNTLEIIASKAIGIWGKFWHDMGEISSGVDPVKLARERALQASEAQTKRIAKEVEQAAAAEEAITAAKLKEGKKRNDELEKQSAEVRKADRELDLYKSGAEPGSAAFLEEKIKSEQEVVKALEEQRAITFDETERNALLVQLRTAQVSLAHDEADLKKKEREEADKAAKQQEEADKKRKKITEDIANKEADIAAIKEKEAVERTAKYRPSLDELAKSRGPYAGIAQQIQRNEAQAKQRFIAGDAAGANALINQNEGYDQDVGYQPTQTEEQTAMSGFAAASAKNPAKDFSEANQRRGDYWNLQHGIGYTKKQHVPGLLDKLRGPGGPLSPDQALVESEKHLKKLQKAVTDDGKLLIKPVMEK